MSKGDPTIEVGSFAGRLVFSVGETVYVGADTDAPNGEVSSTGGIQKKTSTGWEWVSGPEPVAGWEEGSYDSGLLFTEFTATTAGQYRLHVTVVDKLGITVSKSLRFEVVDRPVIVEFTAENQYNEQYYDGKDYLPAVPMSEGVLASADVRGAGVTSYRCGYESADGAVPAFTKETGPYPLTADESGMSRPSCESGPLPVGRYRLT